MKRLIELPEVGDRILYLNPEQVVCLIEAGRGRTQIVTTGLSGESSMSLIVSLDLKETARRLMASDQPEPAPKAAPAAAQPATPEPAAPQPKPAPAASEP
jgi:hypothetical protein